MHNQELYEKTRPIGHPRPVGGLNAISNMKTPIPGRRKSKETNSRKRNQGIQEKNTGEAENRYRNIGHHRENPIPLFLFSIINHTKHTGPFFNQNRADFSQFSNFQRVRL
jgi:hypothetical protein